MYIILHTPIPMCLHRSVQELLYFKEDKKKRTADTKDDEQDGQAKVARK
jgi:hypothetical protein